MAEKTLTYRELLMSVSRLAVIRRHIGLVLLGRSEGCNRSRVRRYMGKPDGLLAGFGERLWLYAIDRKSSGTYAAVTFSEEDEMTDWHILFNIKEPKFIPFDVKTPEATNT